MVLYDNGGLWAMARLRLAAPTGGRRCSTFNASNLQGSIVVLTGQTSMGRWAKRYEEPRW